MPSATCLPHTGQCAAGLRQVRADLIMDSAWGEGRASQCQPQVGRRSSWLWLALPRGPHWEPAMWRWAVDGGTHCREQD